MALTTTSTLSSPISTYYEKRFLMRSEENFVFEQLGLPGRLPKGQGKTVVFNRMTNPTAKTALTEGTDPTPTGLSAGIASATVRQFGNYEQVTDLLELTAIDTTVKEVIDVLAYEAALSIDTAIRDNSLDTGGIALYASGVAARNSIAATDTIEVKDLRKARRQLDGFSARPMKGGKYTVTMHPDVIFDLEGDSNWVNAHIYTEKGISSIYNGEAGEIYGMKVVMTQQAPILINSGSAGTEVYQSHVMGQEFFGVSKLQNLSTYVDSPSPRSALRLYSDIGWKAGFVDLVLNDSFCQRIESAATQ